MFLPDALKPLEDRMTELNSDMKFVRFCFEELKKNLNDFEARFNKVFESDLTLADKLNIEKTSSYLHMSLETWEKVYH